MFDGTSNLYLGGEIFQIHYPKLTVIRGVEHTISLFFNYFPKKTVVNNKITYRKEVYRLFGSGIYHKPHSIFKLKSY